MYDYILTLPLEISTVWKQKLSATTILFFINRYFFMISSVSGALTHINAIKNMTASRLYASQWLSMTSLSISGVREKQYTVGPPGMLTFSFYEGVKWSLVYGLLVLRSLASLFGVCISAPMDFSDLTSDSHFKWLSNLLSPHLRHLRLQSVDSLSVTTLIHSQSRHWHRKSVLRVTYVLFVNGLFKV